MSTKIVDGLSERALARRQELGLTQLEVAYQAEISIAALSCVELGKRNPSAYSLARLCRVLRVSADWLLFGDQSAEAT